jgi:hypothetical protein
MILQRIEKLAVLGHIRSAIDPSRAEAAGTEFGQCTERARHARRLSIKVNEVAAVTVNSEESLTFWFAARPMCAPGRGAHSAGCPEN